LRPAPTSTTVPVRTAHLRCADAIDNRGAPDRTVFLGAVALSRTRALQANPSGEPGPADRWFAKDGLEVASGASVALEVPPRWRGHLHIGWGSPAPRVDRLLIDNCRPPDPSRPWLVFAGGYFVDRPACVAVAVTAGAKTEIVPIGAGAACPGEAPPPAPA
jgi:hypothetical protein